MIVGPGGIGEALHLGTRETTESPCPSPSQVGEDEEAGDDVMRGGSGDAGHRSGSANEDASAVSYGMGAKTGVDAPRAADGTRVSRWM
jgi:hypothetical protein